MHTNSYSEVTPEILKLSQLCEETATINPALYSEYDVKRGLRDVNGKGVLVGLTQIAECMFYQNRKWCGSSGRW